MLMAKELLAGMLGGVNHTEDASYLVSRAYELADELMKQSGVSDEYY